MNRTSNLNDNASGPLAGYLYQFEQGLYSLLSLEDSNSYLSIEDVDDIAAHKEDGTVLFTVQAKHSISQSGSTFPDNSYALWRTLEIWLDKLGQGTLNSETVFICATNKSIPNDSLIHKLVNANLDEAVSLITEKKKDLLEKKNAKEAIGKGFKTADMVLPIINSLLKKGNRDSFKSLVSNLKLRDEPNLKEKIFNKLLLSGDTLSDLQKSNVYQALIGWMHEVCLYRWRNGTTALIKKEDLDSKYQSLVNSTSIIKAIFRNRDEIEVGTEEIEDRKNELFVKQLQDIKHNSDVKKRLIKGAIEDYIRYEIEHTYIINQVGDFTKKDFDQFISQCQEKWQNTFDTFITKEQDGYSDEEMKSKAIEIYNHVMRKLEMNFQTDHSFNMNNTYIKNGGFLKLSNIPEIGWHPNWEELYKN